MNYLTQYSIFFRWCVLISLVLLVAAMALSFCRLIIGKTLPDRVIALDNMSMMVICLVIIFAIITKHALYIDIAIAIALISFLSMVAFAQYIEFQLSKVSPHNRWRDS